jgi:tetratricopeptide (TPR) repeat protein
MKVRASFVLPVVAALGVAMAYVNSFSGVFLLDDAVRITENIDVRSPATAVRGSTRPLVGLSLYANYAIGQNNPADYHAFNLAVHLLAVMLLCGLVRRTVLAIAPEGCLRREAAVLGAFAATLWGLHPLQTESVTYVIQRAESMMGLFYILTLYCMARTRGARRPAAWGAGAVVACALGMLSKPVMITAPATALLYDRLFVARGYGAALKRRPLTYAGLALTWVVAGILLALPNESSRSAGPAAGLISPLAYLATQQGVLLHYMKLTLRPVSLCLDYGWPPASGVGEVLGPALVVTAVAALAAALTVRGRAAGFALLSFFVVLAPTSSLVPIADYAVEHRLYLAIAGPIALAVAGLRRFAELRCWTRPMRTALAAVVYVLLAAGALVLARLTVARNAVYGSVETMAADIVAKRPENFRGRAMLIEALLRNGRCRAAEGQARELLRRAEAALASGDRRFETFAMHARHYHPVAWNGLGRALLCRGRTREAVAALERVARLYPDYAGGRVNLAVARHLAGETGAALDVVRATIERTPGHAGAYALLGYLLAVSGQFGEAAARYEQALRLRPDKANVKLEYGWILAAAPDARLRDGARAVGLARELARATQGRSVAAADLEAAGHAANGDFALAVSAARRAMSLAEAQGAGGAPGRAERAGSLELVESAAPEIAARLALYRRGVPYRLGPPWD